MEKRKIIFVILSLLLVTACTKETRVNEEENMEIEEKDTRVENMKSKYVDITAIEAKKLIDNNPELIIIDVSPKWDEGHIPGAINYYVGDGSLDDAIPSLDKTATYLVYCHVDSASIAGAQKLLDAGFMNVYRLEGNYRAWLNEGYEIE
jgi:rhodanese-related sulfurtransferase